MELNRVTLILCSLCFGITIIIILALLFSAMYERKFLCDVILDSNGDRMESLRKRADAIEMRLEELEMEEANAL